MSRRFRLRRNVIDVDTYHAFFWRVLKTWLSDRPSSSLDASHPANEAIALSGVRSGFPARNLSDELKAAKKAAEAAEPNPQATEEGRICFDLFAPYVGDILHSGMGASAVVATMYPVIILDEFKIPTMRNGAWFRHWASFAG